ncbi:P-loop NTPase, partial [Wenyingzhuangia sp. 1_MG-2023]|nr:P-loop NTPase [Wenyingzhuangia sp. 1_MG-2023]
CGHAEHIFGQDGAERLATTYHTKVLGSLPLATYIREQSDAGVPVVAADESSEVAMMYRHAARRLAVALARGGEAAEAMPEISISED